MRSRFSVLSVALADLAGCQRPTHSTVPAYAGTSGGEAADLAALAGIHLDPWQRDVVDAGLGERPDGSWSAFEVAMILARQNGKNVVFLVRELFGLFVLGEPLILHSAHQYKTAQEAFRDTVNTIDGCAYLSRKVRRVVRTNGEEAVELTSGSRLRFIARSMQSGRGFRAKTIVLDEALILGDDAMSALLPTLSAQPNPQLWYGSSAGTPESQQLGRIWRRIRKAAASGVADPSLAGFEWAADLCTVFCPDDCAVHDRVDDPDVWAKTNPALGIRHSNGTQLTVDAVANELATFGAGPFARERLSVGDYPSDEGEQWAVIGEDKWAALEDGKSQAGGQLAFAVEVGPERRASVVAVAGERSDGKLHLEVVERGTGTEWVPAKLAELVRRWRPVAVVIDPGSHAGSLIEPAAKLGVEVVAPFSARDAAQACGQFYDACQQDDLRHRGQGELTAAVAGAKTRMLADGWAWDRKNASVDISPLVAVTLAGWGIRKFGRPRLAPYDIARSVG